MGKKKRNPGRKASEKQQRARPAAPSPTPPVSTDTPVELPPAPPPMRIALTRTQYVVLLAMILAGCFCFRLYRLSAPDKLIFDEVYWGFTAKEIVRGNPQIYDPWAKPPPGLAFEWTHPPLGKLLIAIGVKWLGTGSIGLRISSVVFGTACVWLAAMLALELFGSYAIALLTAYLLSIETTGVALSRISMVDVHGLFFMLAGFIEYVRWRKKPQSVIHLLAASLGFGLAGAVKWNALFLYAVVGMDALLLWMTSRLPNRFWWWWFPWTFGFIPAGIYLLSYFHFFGMGYSWDQFVELQRQMWWYHTHLKATHSSASETWQWILNIKPVWFDTGTLPDGRIAEVFAIGNHVILYTGLVAFIWCCRKLVSRWDGLVALTAIAYFAMWFPWTFSPRLKFFYHYLPSISFLCILTAYAAIRTLETGEIFHGRFARTAGFAGWLIAATAWTAVLYPFVASVPVSPAADHFFRRTGGIFIF